MTLENPWARKAAQVVIGVEVDFRQARLDIGERDGFVLVNEIADQEPRPRPGIAGARIGSQEYVVGEDGEIASGHLLAGQHSASLHESSARSMHFAVRFPLHKGSPLG